MLLSPRHFAASMIKLAFIFPLFLLLSLLIQTCHCHRNIKSCHGKQSSSCGHIPKINFPFQLNTDPIDCGYRSLKISCEHNVPILLYSESEKYYVRFIDYDNFTIRLAPLINDPTFFCNHYQNGDPHYIAMEGGNNIFSDYKFIQSTTYTLAESVIIISCQSPLLNAGDKSYLVYQDGNATCSSHDQYAYWYVGVGEFMPLEHLEDSCRVELMALTSYPPNTSTGNISFQDVRDSLEYGFELSWENWYCDNYDKSLCEFSSPGFLRQLMLAVQGSIIYRIITKFQLNWFPDPYNDQRDIPFAMATILFNHVPALYVLLRATFCLIGTPLLVALLVYKWRRRHLSFYDNIEDYLQNTYDQMMPIRYSYRDIKKITNGFKDKLGEGGYGSVYKGKLCSGQLAAIKMLGKVDSDGNDFINEVATIGRVHHFNVVHLIGFCAEGSKRALVYPFMPNGSLDKYIFSQEKGNMKDVPTISNAKMYEIALGVARGIEYLHRGCDMQILHFDIKPHNILLDEHLVPKVADFGLAKLYPTNKCTVSLTAVKGTIGYMAPEFFYRSVGGISYKADVYSFGRMLMEMAERKRNLSSSSENSSQIFLPSWVHDQFSQGNEVGTGDVAEEDREITKKMKVVGLWCVQLKPIDRPSMNKVIEMLQKGVDTLQFPPKPSFAPSFQPMNVEGSTTTMIGTSQHTSSIFMVDELVGNEEELVIESNVLSNSMV